VWRQLQRNGMARDSSWAEPAQQYADLYRRLAPLTELVALDTTPPGHLLSA
jgi:glycogen synthase